MDFDIDYNLTTFLLGIILTGGGLQLLFWSREAPVMTTKMELIRAIFSHLLMLISGTLALAYGTMMLLIILVI